MKTGVEPLSATCRSAHIAGIAGVGMSAIAELLVALGWQVSGSDRFLDQSRDLPVLRKLAAHGVRLYPQDGGGLNAGSGVFVFSTAIEADNPDLLAAQSLGLPVRHRAAMLAELCGSTPLAAVAGTAGKTTVTGMAGFLLAEAGFDPTVVNGGAVVNWRGERDLGSARAGRPDRWVLEADESDRSFLAFHPEWAVITNISKDHFEYDEVVALFAAFARQVKQGIVCGPGVAEILSEQGIPHDRLIDASAKGMPLASGRGIVYDGVEMAVPVMGRHNLLNALCAVALVTRLGLSLEQCRDGLARFAGIERRLELAGETGGVRVFDDYAHNPAKIAAAWRAVAESGPGAVHAVWRPHGFAPLANMMEELAEALAGAWRPGDVWWLLPVYYAGGTASQSVRSEDLEERLRRRGVRAEAVDGYGTLARRLSAELRSGDSVLVMGARDPDLPVFARHLGAAWDRPVP